MFSLIFWNLIFCNTCWFCRLILHTWISHAIPLNTPLQLLGCVSGRVSLIWCILSWHVRKQRSFWATLSWIQWHMVHKPSRRLQKDIDELILVARGTTRIMANSSTWDQILKSPMALGQTRRLPLLLQHFQTTKRAFIWKSCSGFSTRNIFT